MQPKRLQQKTLLRTSSFILSPSLEVLGMKRSPGLGLPTRRPSHPAYRDSGMLGFRFHHSCATAGESHPFPLLHSLVVRSSLHKIIDNNLTDFLFTHPLSCFSHWH